MNRLIHPSAWKVNAQKFVLTEFYEIRIAEVQRM